jgi:hypothetical protein
MANNITPKLRAFVRIDGTGRVIPGAPIFQAHKPKVGNWREIPMYYRGNSTTTTTTTSISTSTTTTTSAPSTTTTTTTARQVYSFSVAFITKFSANQACGQYSGGSKTTMYSNVATLTTGSTLYNDSALTDPWSGGQFDYWYAVDNNGTISSIQVGDIANGTPGVILTGPTPCA